VPRLCREDQPQGICVPALRRTIAKHHSADAGKSDTLDHRDSVPHRLRTGRLWACQRSRWQALKVVTLNRRVRLRRVVDTASANLMTLNCGRTWTTDVKRVCRLSSRPGLWSSLHAHKGRRSLPGLSAPGQRGYGRVLRSQRTYRGHASKTSRLTAKNSRLSESPGCELGDLRNSLLTTVRSAE
jgi:hypothetical protein